ncbi:MULTISPECIES: HAD family hydrolase [Acidobacteriaceae]|uniref:HAD family hydrolase n=1 Tax=Acidobacteriaceae TaxID=204434 RepID=UPI00131CD32F|nr:MULTISPECIES: HAD-IA family hydrolase [Acidobacteriaceae]MDW5264773.1 HAD-IA family hydrolase [Edaphobacter sp.]
MSLTPIKTIFWDIGGVLLANGWDSRQRGRVLAALGVDLAAYEAVHDEVNYYWERGLISAEDFFAQTVLETNPDLNLTFEQLWPLVCSESKVLHHECFDILAALKNSGQYRLATINNESKELNAYRLDTFQLRPYFDYFICSGYVHEMKPLPDIYRAAIDISGLPPETSLFIDDKQENCIAARSFGMNAIHFELPAQLRASLTQHGIAV